MEFTDKMLSLKLTAFINSKVIERIDEDGNLVRGVFIPIEVNELYESPKTKHIYCTAFINYDDRRYFKKVTHILTQHFTRAHLEKVKALGVDYKHLGYLYDTRNNK